MWSFILYWLRTVAGGREISWFFSSFEYASYSFYIRYPIRELETCDFLKNSSLTFHGIHHTEWQWDFWTLRGFSNTHGSDQRSMSPRKADRDSGEDGESSFLRGSFQALVVGDAGWRHSSSRWWNQLSLIGYDGGCCQSKQCTDEETQNRRNLNFLRIRSTGPN